MILVFDETILLNAVLLFLRRRLLELFVVSFSLFPWLATGEASRRLLLLWELLLLLLEPRAVTFFTAGEIFLGSAILVAAEVVVAVVIEAFLTIATPIRSLDLPPVAPVNEAIDDLGVILVLVLVGTVTSSVSCFDIDDVDDVEVMFVAVMDGVVLSFLTIVLGDLTVVVVVVAFFGIVLVLEAVVVVVVAADKELLFLLISLFRTCFLEEACSVVVLF